MRRVRPSSKWISTWPALVAILSCAGEKEEIAVQAPPPPKTELVVVASAPTPAVTAVVTPSVVRASAEEKVVVEQAPASSSQVVVDEPSHGNASVENWAARHRSAAKELGAWAHANPEAAKFVFQYDGHRPERNRELVLWAIYHPGEDVTTFAAKHPGWEWFDKVAARHRAGTDQFLDWARHNPVAAEELVGHPRGLLWAGEHLYAAEWRSQAGQ